MPGTTSSLRRGVTAVGSLAVLCCTTFLVSAVAEAETSGDAHRSGLVATRPDSPRVDPDGDLLSEWEVDGPDDRWSGSIPANRADLEDKQAHWGARQLYDEYALTCRAVGRVDPPVAVRVEWEELPVGPEGVDYSSAATTMQTPFTTVHRVPVDTAVYAYTAQLTPATVSGRRVTCQLRGRN